MKLGIESKADKAGIPLHVAESIVVHHHELEHLIPKNKLTTMNIDLAEEAYQFIKTVSKQLKVSEDAVIVTYLLDHIRNLMEGEDE